MTFDSSQLTAVLDDPYARARKEKENGRKIVAVTPMHFPEELVHASGALPVVLQESGEPATLGYGHIYPFYCGFSRSNVDLAVKGKLDLFDAVVVSDMCLQTRHMSHIMQRNMKSTPFAYIQWPLEASPERWLETTETRLEKVRQRLSTMLGTQIPDEAIQNSIRLYNQNRAALRVLYGLRQEKPGILRAKEVMGTIMSGMVAPKEENTARAQELIGALKQEPPRDNGQVKLFLSGHLCQAVKPDILDLIEDLGGAIVGDDLYTGYRYIASDAGEQESPIRSLARRYLELAVPCPSRSDPKQDWAEYLIQQTRQSGAQGIVVLVVKFCEAHMIYYPHLKEVLAGSGVPHLMIETEHEVVSLEGIRTRVQAFLEMLRAAPRRTSETGNRGR